MTTNTENKYLLASDAYSMFGKDGYSVQSYLVEKIDNKYLLKPLKEISNAICCNLENFVGDGESVEYDLIQVPSNFDVCVVMIKKDGDKHSSTVSIDKNAEGESIELLYFEAVKNSLLHEVEIDNIEFIASYDLTISNTLEELNEMIADNDFAKRHLDSEDERLFLKKYFKDEKARNQQN